MSNLKRTTTTQLDMMRATDKSIREQYRVFADMQRGPAPLTNEIIDKLAAKRPEIWEKFRGLGK
jgi:hypothetical protein